MFNIFHPFDPVAYRLEPLIIQLNENSLPPPPEILPHHRGRKRIHLEVRDAMMKMSDDIKKRVYGSFQSVSSFFSRSNRAALSSSFQEEILQNYDNPQDAPPELIASSSTDDNINIKYSNSSVKYNYGRLNEGSRIDYALQEGPIEVVNPYLFSISSHLCYW